MKTTSFSYSAALENANEGIEHGHAQMKGDGDFTDKEKGWRNVALGTLLRIDAHLQRLVELAEAE